MSYDETDPDETPTVPEPASEPAEQDRGLPLLDDVEQRVLGCLMEKQKTTPANYPMTLNSLTLACNQKSSRDPVVEYSERMVDRALGRLREIRLACMVSTAGGHVPKFRHLLENLAEFSTGEYAVLCVLLLRGPQTVGQLRSRTERIYSFAELKEVQDILDRLAHDHPDALVAMLPREAGRKDHRYAHLLGEHTASQEPTAAPSPAPVAEAAPDVIQELTERVARLEAALEQVSSKVDGLVADLQGPEASGE